MHVARLDLQSCGITILIIDSLVFYESRGMGCFTLFLDFALGNMLIESYVLV